MSSGVAAKKVKLADDVAAMAFVQSSFLFQGVAEEVLGRIFESGEVIEFDADAVVLAEGATEDGLFVVLEGGVTLVKQCDDGLVDIAALDRQAVFGETDVLTRQPRTTSVVTRTQTRLVRLDGETVRAAADTSTKLGRKLAALMAGRARDTEKKMGESG